MITTTAPTSPLPGVYIYERPSPSFSNPSGSDILGIVGEADRGVLDYSQDIGDDNDFRRTYGNAIADPGSAQATPPPLSLYTDCHAALLPGVSLIKAVRVAGATAASAYVTLLDSAIAALLTLHAATLGTWATSLQMAVSLNGPAVAPTSWTLSVVNAATQERDYLTNLPLGSATAWAAAIAQINRSATLVVATPPVLALPGAPTVTAGAAGSGTLPAGIYYGLITVGVPGVSESLPSAEFGPITVPALGSLRVTPGTVATGTPTGAPLNAYLTQANGASGTETFAASTPLLSPASTTVLTITAPPVANQQRPAQLLLPTGGYTIRHQATAAPSASVLAPVAGEVAFPAVAGPTGAPGNNGADAGTARHMGAPGAPNTGIYALTGLDPHPHLVFLGAGAASDATTWATLAALALTNNWIALACLPQGTTDAGALAAVAASGVIGTPQAGRLAVPYPWAKLNLPAYNGGSVVLAAPTSLLAGIQAVQAVATAGFNKALPADVLGPEFDFSDTQLATLISAPAYLSPLTRKIPRKNALGFLAATTLDGTDLYVLRVTGLIADAGIVIGGDFIGETNDAVARSLLQDRLTSFLDALARDDTIPSNPQTGQAPVATPVLTAGKRASLAQSATGSGATTQAGTLTAGSQRGYAVICNDANNLVGPGGVATTDMFAEMQVQIKPNTKRVIIGFQFGTQLIVVLPQS